MSTLTPTSAKPAACRHLPLNLHRPSLSNSVSSLSFRIPQFSHSPTRASSHQNASHENTINPFHNEKPKPVPFLTPLKSAAVATVAAAAIFLSQLGFPRKPAIANPVASPPPSVETQDAISDLEREQSIEEQLMSNPSDVDALKSLMEIQIKSKKVPEALSTLDKLIEVEPEAIEWPMMKAHLYAHSEEFELAKRGFGDLLKKDPFRVEAYHGLVTVASQEESSEELVGIEKRVEEVMKLCKEESKESELRDFKLLLAQIRVLEGRYDDALKVYEELVKEEPRDFRPYLCQGIIYTLLKNNNEAEKNFEKYRRLVPQGHPYTRYFDDNMIATKLFAQRAENERAMANN